MARHLLIASTTWKYANPGDDRPTLPKVLEDIVQLFTQSIGGYTRELLQIAENPKSTDLTNNLDQWFADPDRDPSDWVVLYYTGHAEIVGADSLYLLTADFVEGLHTSTAFDFQKFANLILAPAKGGRPRKVKNLLVILDTCFAGQGLAELSSKLSLAFRRNSGGAFYLVGAALLKQEAQAGALARALIASIEELSNRYVVQEYLFLDQIFPTINQYLRKAGLQDAIRIGVDSTTDIPEFFPNRSFLNTNGKPVAASDAQRAISDQEFREHWGPRARGVEFDSQPGFYFSGRKVVLDKLVLYLNDSVDNKTLVVTGSPGSGKSAILSRLVNLSVPELREKWSFPDLGPAIPSFDLALHAKGKTTRDVIARLSKVLDVAPTKEAVLGSLKESRKQVRLVVDALDEAAEPAALATELLGPMSSFETVKLIVGTRVSEMNALGEANVIDIDRPENALRDDVVDYVRARLLRIDEPDGKTPYAGKDALVNEVAEAVAQKAYPNFLVARLIVEDLLSRENPVDPGSISFPTSVATAFDLYLSRFGKDEKTVRDLLLPLAYAEGQGLPWDNIWAPLATVLSRRTSFRDYSDEDIRWLLTHAGTFVLESTENGRSVYRLFHQALADTLRMNVDLSWIHTSFVEVLTSAVPDRVGSAEAGEVRDKDWLLSNLYIRSHLCAHADAAGVLANFLEDPLFLLAASPNPLLAVLVASKKSLPRQIIATYRDVVHHIQAKSASSSASYMEMSARKRGLAEFADRISNLEINQLWEVSWARWTPPAASKSFAFGNEPIRCLEIKTLGDARTAALVGRDSGAVEVWDVTSRSKIRQWTNGVIGWVKKLDLANINGRDFIVAAWSLGDLGAFDLTGDTRVIRAPERKGESAQITALCVAERQGRPVCITSHQDHHLSVWDLPTLQLIQHKNRTGAIYDLHVIRKREGALLFGAGDSMGDSVELGDDVDWKQSREHIGTLRLLSVDDLSLVWHNAGDQGGYFDQVSKANFFGRNLAAGYHWGTDEIEIWDLDNRRLACTLQRTAPTCWLYRFGEDVLLVWVCDHELGAVRLVPTEREGFFSLKVEEFGAPVTVQGTRFSEIVYEEHHAVILSAVFGHVRGWELDDLLQESLDQKKLPPMNQNDVSVFSNISVLGTNPQRPAEFYAYSRNNVLALNASDGKVLWNRDLKTDATVQQIKIVEATGELAVADGEGWIHLLDPATGGTVRRTINTGCQIQAMEIVSWNSQSLAFITCRSGRAWSLRIWDLDNEREIPTNGEYQLRFGEEDKRLYGLAVHSGEHSIRFAFAGQYGKAMVADFDGGIVRHPRTRRPFEEWRLPFGGTTYTQRLAVLAIDGKLLLAAGTEEGQLAIFDFNTGEIQKSLERAHIGKVTALAFNDLSDSPIILSAGFDGSLCFWTTQLEELLKIETGEPINDALWVSGDLVAVGGPGGVLMVRLIDRFELLR